MHLNWCNWGMSVALQYGEGWMIINYEQSLNNLHRIYNGVYCKKKTSYLPLVYYKKCSTNYKNVQQPKYLDSTCYKRETDS